MTIDNILRENLPEYIKQYRLLPSHNRTIVDILTCRTNKLGGQTWYCEDCRKIHYSYHSCKNRMCPKCQNNQTTAWLNKQYKKLLPVEYFMVTFTIPSELRNLFRNNQKECYNLFFKASSESLRQLALDKRFIGGEIGMLGVLQTWASNLIYHPHIHYIVPGIGPTKDNTIKFAKNKFLMYWKPLANMFRKKLCDGLMEKNMTFPSIISQVQWIVDVRAVGSGKSSLKYLSKYIYRTAISNRNIMSSENGTITLSIKDKQTRKIIKLSATEFLRRFLQHTLPKGFQKVRSYGLLHPKRKSTLYLLQLLLKTKIQEECVPEKQTFKCPACGREMVLINTTNRRRAPSRFIGKLLPQITKILRTIHQPAIPGRI